MLGEIPRELSPEARRVLDAHRIDPTHEPATHPALKGLPRNGLSYRIVEDLLRSGETTTAEVMARYEMSRATVDNTIQFLHRSGRITPIRDESHRYGRRYIWTVTDTEAIAKGAVITEVAA